MTRTTACVHCICLALSFLLLQQPAQALIPVRCRPPPPISRGLQPHLGWHAAYAHHTMLTSLAAFAESTTCALMICRRAPLAPLRQSVFARHVRS